MMELAYLFTIITSIFYILPKSMKSKPSQRMTEICNYIISLAKWYHKCTRCQVVGNV